MTRVSIHCVCEADRASIREVMKDLNAGRQSHYKQDCRDPLDPPIVKVLLEVPILYQGWECDEHSWVVERADGSLLLACTSHGRPYIGEASELVKKLAEYEAASTKAREALTMLGGAK